MIQTLLPIICKIFALLVITTHSNVAEEISVTASAEVVRRYLDQLSKEGRILDTVNYLTEVEKHYGHLVLDNKLPSLYSFLGVALYSTKRLDEAIVAFKKGLVIYPNETRAWINLGEIEVQKFYLNDAAESFTKAFHLGEYAALPRILRTKGWSLSWKDFEAYCADFERFANLCLLNVENCIVETSSGFEYTSANPAAFKVLTSLSPNAQTSSQAIPSREKASLWKNSTPTKRLKIGFVSSDYGIHPVATLIRGLLQTLNTSRVEVFCFSVHNAISWWGGNISTSVEHFHVLESNNNLRDNAVYIASFKIDILIDLNGHTMFSGLPMMAYQPAPLQISYLGLPTTTAAHFIQYYLSDYVTIPPEQHHHFSEKLLLMNPCYIANDYAQVQGAVALTNLFDRSPREALSEDYDLSTASILLATLSNSQKWDPNIFHVWMNIMHRFAGSKMVVVEYAGHDVYKQHLANHGRYYGISTDRLINIPQAPWIDHLMAKTAIDLVLDTTAKNAHTTGLDGIWAGVPTISLARGSSAISRAAESIAAALESDTGMTFSLKDYEDLAFSMIRKRQYSRQYQDIIQPSFPAESTSTKSSAIHNPYSPPKSLQLYNPISFIQNYPVLVSWRRLIHQRRLLSPLFNTPLFTLSFEHFLQAAWEGASLQKYHSMTTPSLSRNKRYHFFPARSIDHDVRRKKEKMPIQLYQIYAEESQTVPKSILERLLHQQNYSQILSDEMMPSIEKYFQQRGRRRQSQTKSPLKRSKSHKASSKESSDQYSATTSSPHETDFEDETDDEECTNKARGIRFPALPAYVFDGRTIMLNIGGVRNAEGWLNVNSKRSNYFFDGKIDIIRPMHDLRGMPNNSVGAIYSSHTLEHSTYGKSMITKTLAEWFRVLRPGGILLIGVPDLTVLAKMYLDPTFSFEDRWIVTQMMYGGQSDEGDYHHVGFSEELLVQLLLGAGFCNITRVSSFNIGFYDRKKQETFYDTSEKFYKGYFVSLNLIAKVCPEQKGLQEFDGFNINHNAIPYFGDKLPERPSTNSNYKRRRSKHPSLTPEQIEMVLQYFQNHPLEL